MDIVRIELEKDIEEQDAKILENFITALYAWKVKYKLNNQVFKALIEGWRRRKMFNLKKGSPREILLLPSWAKEAIRLGYIAPSYDEIPRTANWYHTTEKGGEILDGLKVEFCDGINDYLFNL